MNAFETIALAFLATAAEDAPLFVHSAQGMLILNASENLLANIIAALNKQPGPVAVGK